MMSYVSPLHDGRLKKDTRNEYYYYSAFIEHM